VVNANRPIACMQVDLSDAESLRMREWSWAQCRPEARETLRLMAKGQLRRWRESITLEVVLP
jgi:hypothetical protein